MQSDRTFPPKGGGGNEEEEEEKEERMKGETRLNC